MNILIIGSKGFIGGKAVEYFSSFEDYSVWGCDVVTDYNASQYFLIDSGNSDFSDIFQKQNFDACINCSGAASVPESLLNPFRDYSLNTFNVYKILEAIRKFNPLCKFLNLSSAAVYGNPCKMPVEESDPTNPLSPYGNHKLHSEYICKQFYTFFNIKTVSLRIFSAYGPGLQKQLFWDLYKKANTSDIITLFGSGNESRDFIFIDDLMVAIRAIMNHAQFTGESINVANGEEITIKKAVDTFYDLLGTSKQIIFEKSHRAGDPLNWKAEISILTGFGYHQKYSLEEGLRQYIQWLEEKK